MSVEVACGRCGEKITIMRMIKPVKDVLKPYSGRCPSCGQQLSSTEFTLDVSEA
ncbi:hypothetical protein CENSYa_1778 [Cenarchaeum symbiosum A]|uniref:Uncharacterized protein n=1 Tax=Cenarchaeum symbiosum (strain A) TaxID=414004 RepID=A0RYH1_CENSY|nr:hypothetical protein CENSYa_1778 [Cenarchaeum symbiosum A]